MLIASEVFGGRKGRHVWKDQTICELHRMIYDHLVLNAQDRPELLVNVLPLLEKAYICGIKMTKKLLDNKMSLPEWDKHTSKEAVESMRKLRVELERELAKNK